MTSSLLDEAFPLTGALDFAASLANFALLAALDFAFVLACFSLTLSLSLSDPDSEVSLVDWLPFLVIFAPESDSSSDESSVPASLESESDVETDFLFVGAAVVVVVTFFVVIFTCLTLLSLSLSEEESDPESATTFCFDLFAITVRLTTELSSLSLPELDSLPALTFVFAPLLCASESDEESESESEMATLKTVFLAPPTAFLAFILSAQLLLAGASASLSESLPLELSESLSLLTGALLLVSRFEWSSRFSDVLAFAAFLASLAAVAECSSSVPVLTRGPAIAMTALRNRKRDYWAGIARK